MICIKIADKGKMRLFADDTIIFIIANDLKLLFTLANDITRNVYQWLVSNKLSINFEKTNYMVFKANNYTINEIKNLNLSISINNILLSRTTSIKYLGVWLDDQLSWNAHVTQLLKKVSSLIGIIYRKKYLLSARCRKNIYFGLVYSSLVYCIEVYGRAKKSVLKPLIVKCNTFLRILQDKPRRYSIKELYRNYETLPVNLLYKLFILKLMYRVVYCKCLLPSVIVNLFSINDDIHSYNTRSRHEFNIQANSCTNSISYIGPSMWLKLPRTNRELSSLASFLHHCKLLLLDEL